MPSFLVTEFYQIVIGSVVVGDSGTPLVERTNTVPTYEPCANPLTTIVNVAVVPGAIAVGPIADVVKIPAVEPDAKPFCATALVTETMTTALIVVGWLLVTFTETVANDPSVPCSGNDGNVNEALVATTGIETDAVVVTPLPSVA